MRCPPDRLPPVAAPAHVLPRRTPSLIGRSCGRLRRRGALRLGPCSRRDVLTRADFSLERKVYGRCRATTPLPSPEAPTHPRVLFGFPLKKNYQTPLEDGPRQLGRLAAVLPLLLPTTFETPLHQDPQRATSGAPRAPRSSIPDDVLNAPATRRPSRHLPQHFQHNASLIRIASTTSARNPVLSDSLQLRPDACQPTAVPDLLPSAVATMQRLPPSPPPHPCPTDTWPVHRRHCNMPNHPVPPSPSARRATSTVSPYPSTWTLPLQSCCSSTRAVPHSLLRTLSLPRDHADHRHCNMPNHPDACPPARQHDEQHRP